MFKAVLEVMHIRVSYIFNVETSKSDDPSFAIFEAGGQS
jgi:hypothetical protein